MYDRLNIDWSLVPIEVLRNVEVPQLWALAFSAKPHLETGEKAFIHLSQSGVYGINSSYTLIT